MNTRLVRLDIRSTIIKYFLIVELFFTVALLISSCNKAIGVTESSAQESINVSISDSLNISIPINYGISKGTGDDSSFVQILSPDGLLFINTERGVEFKKEEKDLVLFKSYEKRDVIKVINKKQVTLAYRETTSRLRNISGHCFLNHENKYEALFNFQVSKDQYHTLKEIIKSIHIK